MRILYYCPEYYFNHGGRTHAHGFFGALGKLPDVSACFLYPKSGPKEVLLQNSEGNKATRERLWFLPPAARQIVRFFRPKPALTRAVIGEIIANKCDALVLRTGAGLPSIRRIKKACPDTVICLEVNSAHFDESFSALPLRSLFQKWEVSRFLHTDAITVVSSYLKTYLQNYGVPAEKILVNQNGVDAAVIEQTESVDVREQYNIPPDAFLIGYIGGMERFRRLPEVIASVAQLRRAGNDDIYLLMVGDGVDMPAVKGAIKAEHDLLAHAVKLAGWQKHDKIPKFLAAFDIAVFPFTNAYCSPLKLFEYLAAGLPVIGPDTPAVREVFEDGVHLRLARQDGSNFNEAIMQMKTDSAMRGELSKNGQRLVMKEYTWEKNAKRVVAHIQKSAENDVSSVKIGLRIP